MVERMSFRSPKLLKAANGQACTICGRNDMTTVAAHCRSVALGSGTGIKVPDCLTAWLCHGCHDRVDGRIPGWTAEQRSAWWNMAFAKTIIQLFEQGIVVVK